jgi:hypothetical protein
MKTARKGHQSPRQFAINRHFPIKCHA